MNTTEQNQLIDQSAQFCVTVAYENLRTDQEHYASAAYNAQSASNNFAQGNYRDAMFHALRSTLYATGMSSPAYLAILKVSARYGIDNPWTIQKETA